VGRMPGATERGYVIAAAPGVFDALRALLAEAHERARGR